MSEARIGRLEARPGEARQGLPEAFRRGNRMRGGFRPQNRLPPIKPIAYWPPLLMLTVMTVHFPFQNTYVALPPNFFGHTAENGRPSFAGSSYGGVQ